MNTTHDPAAPAGRFIELLDGSRMSCFDKTALPFVEQPGTAEQPEKKRAFTFMTKAKEDRRHAEHKLFSDSRMFLCPIAVSTFFTNNLTLGIMLEWWLAYPAARHTDAQGRHWLIYGLNGSPLSGMNRCSMVDEQGNNEIITVSSFGRYCGSLHKINDRYTEAKKRYPSLPLQDVLKMLRAEDLGTNGQAIDTRFSFMQARIDALTRQLGAARHNALEWHDRYAQAIIGIHREELLAIIADYRAGQASLVAPLTEQRLQLRKALRQGRVMLRDYEPRIKAINIQLRDTKSQLCRETVNKLRAILPTDIRWNIEQIESYLNKSTD